MKDVPVPGWTMPFGADCYFVTALPSSPRDSAQLTLAQNVTRAIAIHDARCGLLRQGWDLASVLRTTWTVEFQSDAVCTAELVTGVQRTHPGSGGVEAAYAAQTSQSSFNCRDAAEGLKVEVYLSREALTQLGAGKELLLTPPPSEGDEIEVAQLTVRSMPE